MEAGNACEEAQDLSSGRQGLRGAIPGREAKTAAGHRPRKEASPVVATFPKRTLHFG